jgi:hypothetical protein
MDILHSITGIFTTADMVTLLIMTAVSFGAGLAMQRMSSLVTATFGALVLFGVTVFVRATTLGGKDAITLARTEWNGLLSLQMHDLLAYAIAFAVAISLVHYVCSLVMSDDKHSGA